MWRYELYSSGWKSHFVITTKNLWVLQMDVLINRTIWINKTVKKYTIPWSYNLWWIWLRQKRCYSWNTLTLISTILCHLVLTSYQQHIPQVQPLLFPQRDTAVSSEGERSMLVSPPSHPTIYSTLTIKHNWNNFQWITKPLLR